MHAWSATKAPHSIGYHLYDLRRLFEGEPSDGPVLPRNSNAPSLLLGGLEFEFNNKKLRKFTIILFLTI